MLGIPGPLSLRLATKNVEPLSSIVMSLMVEMSSFPSIVCFSVPHNLFIACVTWPVLSVLPPTH